MKMKTQKRMDYEELINFYFESLNERDEMRRIALIENVWEADSVFVSPAGKAAGHTANNSLISKVFKQFPEVTTRRTGVIEVLHEDYLRFGFEAVQPDGTILFKGTDFAVIKNGKLQSVVGFFDTSSGSPEQRNINTVHQVYEAFNAGDLERWFTFFAPNFEWHAADNSPIADHSPYIGLDAIRNEVFPRLVGLFPGMKLRTDEIMATENKAVMLGYYYNLPQKSGDTTEAQVAHVLTFENDKIVKFQQYLDTLKFSVL
jgi:ketosteroid isomerase-like protein